MNIKDIKDINEDMMSFIITCATMLFIIISGLVVIGCTTVEKEKTKQIQIQYDMQKLQKDTQ